MSPTFIPISTWHKAQEKKQSFSWQIKMGPSWNATWQSLFQSDVIGFSCSYEDNQQSCQFISTLGVRHEQVGHDQPHTWFMCITCTSFYFSMQRQCLACEFDECIGGPCTDKKNVTFGQ